MRSRFSFALALVLSAIPAAAQTVGNYVLAPNSSVANLSRPYTVIDVSSPVDVAGTIGAVAIRVNNECLNGFKIRFFRPSSGTYTPFAERGPFGATTPLALFTLTPPVAVQPGDLIGVVALAECASPVGQVPVLFKNALQFSGDISAPVTQLDAEAVLLNFAVALYGAPNANSEVRTQVLPAAGAAQGAFGATFKTDIFLTNPRSTRATGRLVYHPENTTGTPSDPSFPFIVDSRSSQTFSNFVATTLGLSGKGSIDVYTRIGFEAPRVNARIYEDGTAGSKGFTIDALTEGEALSIFDTGVLFGPIDPAKLRMNIAIRTLSEETRLEFQLFASNGIARAVTTQTYPADYFTQTDFNSLFGVSPNAGDTIIVFPRSGQAYVIGSIIDNTSNDPSAQLARQLK